MSISRAKGLNPLRSHNLPHVCSDLAAPRLVVCLSMRQHDFNSKLICVWISGRKSGTGTNFLPSAEAFPCKYHQRMLHTHSRTCHRCCMCLAIASLVKQRDIIFNIIRPPMRVSSYQRLIFCFVTKSNVFFTQLMTVYLILLDWFSSNNVWWTECSS